jgi:hypothetical protein
MLLEEKRETPRLFSDTLCLANLNLFEASMQYDTSYFLLILLAGIRNKNKIKYKIP